MQNDPKQRAITSRYLERDPKYTKIRREDARNHRTQAIEKLAERAAMRAPLFG